MSHLHLTFQLFNAKQLKELCNFKAVTESLVSFKETYSIKKKRSVLLSRRTEGPVVWDQGMGNVFALGWLHC
jgi:hypothetical protein